MASLGSAALGVGLLPPRAPVSSLGRARPSGSRAGALRVRAAAEAPPKPPKQPKQPRRAKADKVEAPKGVAVLEAEGASPPGVAVAGRRHRAAPAQPAPPPPAPEAEPEEPALPALPALDDVNPIELGRRSRAFVDDVWQRVLSLGGTRASGAAALEGYELEREYVAAAGDGGGGDFTVPQAAFHTVLVVGATGRVGTVLLRKLSLRGYTVRALVRSQDAAASLPRSVDVVVGDLGDAEVVARAMDGVTKVVMCARARSEVTADLANVDKVGMSNLIKAMTDGSSKRQLLERRAAKAAKKLAAAARAEGVAPAAPTGGPTPRARPAAPHRPATKFTLVKFSLKTQGAREWSADVAAPAAPPPGSSLPRAMRARVTQLPVEVLITDGGDLRWAGQIAPRGDAQVSGPLCLPRGIGARTLRSAAGLVMRVRGDGKRYSCVLRSGDAAKGEEEHWYGASFATRPTWEPLRVPFSDFRPLAPTSPPLDTGRITRLGFRFDAKAQPRAATAAAAAPAQRPDRGRGSREAAAREARGEAPQVAAENLFALECAFIKAIPGGAEPDFVYVGCAGVGLDPDVADKLTESKRGAEQLLRNSGLGYTIVRPGPLRDEPGGAKALLFDQGGRITEGIAIADVADVCLRAMHEAEARNTSFEVCHESTVADSRYELVAHLPQASSNYLQPALSVLEKNT